MSPPRSVTAALMGDPSHGPSVITEALGPKPSPPMAAERVAVATDKKLGNVEPDQSVLGPPDQIRIRGASGLLATERPDVLGSAPPEQYAENAHCIETGEPGEISPPSQVRPIAPMAFEGLKLRDIPTGPPALEWMAPADLLVDETYQRGLGPKGEAQIRRVAEHWDWRRTKPVIAAWTERGFEIIDGQHTAIAAATRGLEKIPVMVVEAADLVARAGAFVGQNRDRIALTQMQLHHAAAAAQDPEALTIEQVCAKAGVNLVQGHWGGYAWKPGDSIAVGVIKALIGRRGAMRAREIMTALVAAGLSPITANDIKAAEYLFTDPDMAADLEPLPEGGADLAAAIRTLGAGWPREAKERAAIKCLPLWKAQASVWFGKCRKRRKPA